MSRLKRLIQEIHRRSLWQVPGIYLFGAWVAFQGIAALADGLAMPEWVPGFAVVVLILGLPIVLATAFVQEGVTGAAIGETDEALLWLEHGYREHDPLMIFLEARPDCDPLRSHPASTTCSVASGSRRSEGERWVRTRRDPEDRFQYEVTPR